MPTALWEAPEAGEASDSLAPLGRQSRGRSQGGNSVARERSMPGSRSMASNQSMGGGNRSMAAQRSMQRVLSMSPDRRRRAPLELSPEQLKGLMFFVACSLSDVLVARAGAAPPDPNTLGAGGGRA